jgi:hypothetical protein
MVEFQFRDGGIPIPPNVGESEFTHPESELLPLVVTVGSTIIFRALVISFPAFFHQSNPAVA